MAFDQFNSWSEVEKTAQDLANQLNPQVEEKPTPKISYCPAPEENPAFIVPFMLLVLTIGALIFPTLQFGHELKPLKPLTSVHIVQKLKS